MKKSSDVYFGESPSISKVLQYAEVAAANDTTILLLGETGTGKGVIARWIHDHSDRKNQQFVEINCSSLRGDLLRSELFGHTKGAFTSAIEDRAGLLEVADGGTLFLDEIGDMDIEVQAQLLKTIEEKSYRRVGENELRYSNFRLICATNRNLSDASMGVQFRKDLFYRICIFPITLPPLRERQSDISGFVKHILKDRGYTHFPIASNILSLLQEYSWPGNIRELQNILERALLLSQKECLTAEHFPNLFTSYTIYEKGTDKVVWNLEELERKQIQKAMAYFNGDKYEASSALGISLSSLYRKLNAIGE